MSAPRILSPAAPSTAVDWSVLGYVLVSLYSVVMLLAVASFWCQSRRRSPAPSPDPTAELEAQATGASVRIAADESKPAFRTVQRDATALLSAEGTPFDLGAINRAIKMGFIRKVYCILATQLAVTTAIVVGFIYAAFEPSVSGAGPDPRLLSPFGAWTYANPYICLALLVPLITIICVLHSVKNRYPWNYLALLTFTGVLSVSLGFTCVYYYGAGYGDQIVLAAAITLALFLALTLFTMQSRFDFTVMGASLYSALWILTFWCWFTFWLLPSSGFRLQQLLSLAFVFIFCLYIVYDTSRIMRTFGVDDYIIASIELYLDIVNLFQYLLCFLASSGRN